MKKLISLVLALMMCVSLMPSAFAAEADERFEDVPEDAWYIDELDYVLRYGVVDGVGDKFYPYELVTRAQFATMLGRLFGGEIVEYGIGEYYEPYADWAIEHGYMDCLSEMGFVPQNSISVEQLACILDNFIRKSGVVPTEYSPTLECADIDAVSEDCRESVESILFYGLLPVDEHDCIHPKKPVTRIECVSILARLSQMLVPIKVRFDYSDLLPGDYELVSEHELDDEEAIDNNIRYMLKNGLHSLDITVVGSTGSHFSYLDALWNYPEYGLKYGTSEGDTLRFWGFPEDYEELQGYQDEAFKAAQEIVDSLYATAQLRADMTEYEKAEVLYYWVVDNTDYDWDSFYGIQRELPFAWLSYGVVIRHLATCGGYTSAYNLLLRLEGIECSTQRMPDHIWSVAILDGTLYHIDTTWSDWKQIEEDGSWFGMTPEFALGRYE